MSSIPTCLFCENATDLHQSIGTADRTAGGLYLNLSCAAHSGNFNGTAHTQELLDGYVITLSSRHTNTHPDLTQKINKICNKAKGRADWDTLDTELSELAKTVGVDLEPWMAKTGAGVKDPEYLKQVAKSANADDDEALFKRIILARKAIIIALESNAQRVPMKMMVSASKNNLTLESE